MNNRKLITIRETADLLSVNRRTFYRNRAFYIAHGLQIVTVNDRPFVVYESIDKMIKCLLKKTA